MKHLLVAEDEKKIRTLIADFFSMKGYEVVEAENGKQAVELVQKGKFDVIFLDVMMPEMDGMAACTEIRKRTDAPIVFLTAVFDEENKLKGYGCGADDYITKPFSLEVLLAKTEALTKRYQGKRDNDGCLYSQYLTLNTKKRVVIIDGQEHALVPKEYEILKMLLENKGQIITRNQILDRVWGEEYFGYDRTVDTHIKKLRKTIGEAAEPLQTVYKAGYIWKE